jgi:hypothetical protein
VGLVLDVDHRVLAEPSHTGEQQLAVAPDQLGPAGQGGVEPLHPPVVEGEDVVLAGFQQEQPLQLVELVGLGGGQVAGLGPVARAVQLPDIVVEGGQLGHHDPGGAVAGDRRPALVVDAAVAEHLEVLGLAPLGRAGIVEAVGHAGPLQGDLLHAVDHRRLGQPGHLQHSWGDVDDVVEL